MPVRAKRVYVIGAGFSREAGLPLQSEILSRIKTLSREGSNELPEAHKEFASARTKVVDFLQCVFGSDPPPSLEDIFTLLDQTISRREDCIGIRWTELEEIKNALYKAIIFLFNKSMAEVSNKAWKLYRSIACHLLKLRIEAGQKGDPFSVVSLNWDPLLEEAIYWCLRESQGIEKADIDYCCYTTPLDDSPHTPSVAQKPGGIFNLKVLKLHGSTNWLLCPNCGRLGTGIGGEEEAKHLYVMQKYCERCGPVRVEELGPGPTSPRLVPFLITPTYLKVFDNPHIQLTWHNAYVELAEAREVVFVGYSIPEADYHLRTLLRRAIKGDTKIVCVLTKEDAPKSYIPQYLHSAYAVGRYNTFFGSGRVNFQLEGARAYFRRRTGKETLSRGIRYLSRKFSRHLLH